MLTQETDLLCAGADTIQRKESSATNQRISDLQQARFRLSAQKVKNQAQQMMELVGFAEMPRTKVSQGMLFAQSAVLISKLSKMAQPRMKNANV
jgi:hypothetical protein